ncbi:hypothetical protein POM88_016492 [Heracleum sosnowskyi]|uniref:Uncharacterized protein n=1 Tax=Heracleum sosnowskyi TaxID=360622 RepID=A0AAD8ILT9_9APIA|nr:hypothetical protein POM88_016492 [Heracleum sosnowskyi]
MSGVPQLETLLDKENFTLEELLNEDDIIQECKDLNSRLINFLRERAQVEELLHYIIDEPPEDVESKHSLKYPFIACGKKGLWIYCSPFWNQHVPIVLFWHDILARLQLFRDDNIDFRSSTSRSILLRLGCQVPFLILMLLYLISIHPWLCYWILHSIALLGDCIDDDLEDRAIDFLIAARIRMVDMAVGLDRYGIL